MVDKGFVKGCVLCWTATLRKILTVDDLQKRHMIIVDGCCMCKESGEIQDHLLLRIGTRSSFTPYWVTRQL